MTDIEQTESSSQPNAAAPDAEVMDRIRAKPVRRAWLLLLLLPFLLVLFGGAAFCRSAMRSASEKYKTTVVEMGDLVLSVTAVGVLEPTDSAEVSSTQSGTVEKVLVSENDLVTLDQPLAILDQSALELQVHQSESRVTSASATVEQAEITAREAKLEAERSERMASQGAATRYEADLARITSEKAQSALTITRAQLKDYRLALDLARRNLHEATVRSPLDGVILRRSIEPGQSVVSALQAATLFEIAADLRHMRLPVEVDEAEVGRVSPGQPATFTVPAWVGRTFEARVDKVHLAPKQSATVVSYIAELTLDNQDLALRPGMTATARIVTEDLRGTLMVPAEALRFEPSESKVEAPSGPHLWILGQDGAPRPIAIEVLGTDGSHSAVQGEELIAGAQVVTSEKGGKKFSAPGSGKGHP